MPIIFLCCSAYAVNSLLCEQLPTSLTIFQKFMETTFLEDIKGRVSGWSLSSCTLLLILFLFSVASLLKTMGVYVDYSNESKGSVMQDELPLEALGSRLREVPPRSRIWHKSSFECTSSLKVQCDSFIHGMVGFTPPTLVLQLIDWDEHVIFFIFMVGRTVSRMFRLDLDFQPSVKDLR